MISFFPLKSFREMDLPSWSLPDGSVSIPVLEEEIVVTKRTVVRERIVVRKEVATEVQRVEAELRREHVDVDVRES